MRLSLALVAGHCGAGTALCAAAACATLTTNAPKPIPPLLPLLLLAVGELEVAFRRMRAFFELLDKLGVEYW